MQDSELKRLLLETCPVLPGQEGRAWAALREQLYGGKRERSTWRWLYYPTWRGLAVAAVVIAAVAGAGGFLIGQMQPLAVATADSEAPGIYAKAFYSRPAKAQVVWLNGMEPATDKPTYLDPTSVISGQPETQKPITDPNSL
jgi:anti-sigma-K factor RskA